MRKENVELSNLLTSRKNYELLILSEHFKDQLINGKLSINDVDFRQFGPTLANIDFSNCVLTNCNFSHLKLSNCNFEGAQLKDCEIFFAARDENTKLAGLSHAALENDSSQLSPPQMKYQKIRKSNWFQYVANNHPELIFKYQFQKDHADENVIPEEGGFYHYYNMQNAKGSSHGWKLHLSVSFKQVEKTFDLIAAILFKHFYHFKVANTAYFDPSPDSPRYRLTIGAQFTIYLRETNPETPIISCKDLKAILKDIETILLENKIKPGEYPESDEKLSVSFFSIRNDQALEERFGGQSYVSAELAGHNYNPANRENPYIEFLENKDKSEFNPIEHFSQLNKTSPEELYQAMLLTTAAIQQEYQHQHDNNADILRQVRYLYSFLHSNGTKRVWKNDPNLISFTVENNTVSPSLSDLFVAFDSTKNSLFNNENYDPKLKFKNYYARKLEKSESNQNEKIGEIKEKAQQEAVLLEENSNNLKL